MTGTRREPARIGIIGASWRAEYYLRIAKTRPDLFTVVSAMTRSDASAQRIKDRWDVPAGTSLDALLGRGPLDFVVISVPRQASASLIRAVVQRGTPVLAETPPATDRGELTDLYSHLGTASPVQVAEQYQFQPQHAARLEAVRTGVIGAVGSTRVSVAHGYHAVSLIRLILGVGFSDVMIDGGSMRDRMLSGRGRDAWSETLELTDSVRVTARLRFDNGEGVYEFNGQQYFSPIRSRHLAIYGEKGEIVDGTISYFKAAGHAVHLNIQREECGADGDLEGYFLRQITAGDQVVYRNPFAPARLSDDELAVAEVMARMSSFVDGGPAFYGLADACHDHYLSLLIDEAVASGEVVHSKPQVWTSAQSVTNHGSSVLARNPAVRT